MRRLALLLLALPALCACDRTIRWQQETRLQDGRVIVVERLSKRMGPGFIESDAAASARELRFDHPDTAEEIRWLLPHGTAAHMLDFEGPATYLVLAAVSATEYNDWQCPNPPWIVYRHLSGVWMRVGIKDLPERFVTPNLLPTTKSDAAKSADGRVTVAEMQAYLGALPQEARGIGRAKVNPLKAGCHEYLLKKLGRGNEADIGGKSDAR